MDMAKRRINIAVTGLNAIDSPGPGIPVIRALRESSLFDVRIIGLSYEALEPGIYMHDLVDKTYQIPLPAAGAGQLLNRLRYIHEAEQLELIIPNFDAELFNFIKLADVLRDEMGIHTFLPEMEAFEARHKINLEAYGKAHGLRIPKSRSLTQQAEIASLSHEFTYPLMVKGKFYDAYIAYTPEQVQSSFYKLSAKWGTPVIVQECIRGQEVNVTALGDGKGQMIGAVPMRKQYVTDKGKAWSGISIDDEKLLDMARRLFETSRWRGGLELEVIRTEEEEYYLIEINPRFPAWIYLAVGCGQNHPEALVRMALGEEVKPFERYDVGKLFIRYSYDMIVELDEFMKISTQGEL